MVFSHTFPQKKTKKNLLRVSRLFSTGFCSDVTIQVFFSCTLACHAGCIYHTYIRTHLFIYEIFNKMPYSKFLCIPLKQFTKSQVNLLVFLVSAQIFRTSWHTGWKVLNCLTNITEIIGKKRKAWKIRIPISSLVFRPLGWTFPVSPTL